ncbi:MULTISPECIES: hypothetical protein [Streptomyces]|uniref:Uncharacterized protein n=1 Tax=Streptomyces flavovirens TaxID=52258 RepID=A0ABV8NAX1_9ACTN|nr:hypothetical protein [Streptomyces sp. MBT51]MBK3592434.1 hypothetical protein [Streptomyces sp. MBT51]
MKKSFALNTDPHVAAIGDTELLFEPEVMGDEFMDAYAEMQAAQQRDTSRDDDDRGSGSADSLRAVVGGVRQFLARLMLPESAELITRVDVVEAGKVLASFTSWAEASKHASEVGTGARPQWALRIPDRLLPQLTEWVLELYSGGKRPPTSSGASARPSPKRGTRGTAASRSKGSTSTRGRSGGS